MNLWSVIRLGAGGRAAVKQVAAAAVVESRTDERHRGFRGKLLAALNGQSQSLGPAETESRG
jgi:hypothetical protein